MCIKEGINYLHWNDLECNEIEAIWLEILVKRGNSFLIRITDHPSNSSKHVHKNFEQKLADILNNISLLNKGTIIIVDLNWNYLDNKNNVLIKDLFKLCGYKQIIKTATRTAKDSSNSATLIVILTNWPDNVINADSIISCLSNHNVIKCVRKLNNIKSNPRTIKCRDYKNYNQTSVSAELSDVSEAIVYNPPDLDMAWNNLQWILSENINRYTPLTNKRVKGKPAPWLNADVKSAMNQRDKLHWKFLKLKSNTDWNMYKSEWNHTTNIWHAQKMHYKSVLKDSEKKSNKFWKTQEPPARLFNIDANCTTNKKSIASRFCSFFSKIIGALKEKSIRFKNFIWSTPYKAKMKTKLDFKLIPVTVSEVFVKLKKLKCKKVARPGNLLPGFLKGYLHYKIIFCYKVAFDV